MMALPVSGSWPTVYLPSHRPSFRLRMFPSPFARLFGMVSAPFATNNTVTKGTKLPKSEIVIRKLSFAPRSRAALSLSMATQFLRYQKAFLLTTAAQNIRDLRRKLLSLGNHFFERLKTANFSTACGTSTLKSLPSRAFFVSDVHLRPRKHFSRCTLDCGFKTAESPALRGFEAGPRALATAALYLVLKSNGLHRSKNLPVKFSFSSKSVPANIAKKLPSQRCSQPFLIAFFNFSHKWPTFAFTGESGYTLGFWRRIAHNGSHGETGGVSDGVVSLPSDRSARSQTSPGRVSERQVLPLLGLGRGCSQRTQKAFGTAMRLCASLSRGVAAPLGCVIQ